MEISVGTSIGPYRLLEKLGAGGMGVVYLAEDSRLGRKVALKTLSPTSLESVNARPRLLREARAAAALNHPNIASIYDVIEVDDRVHIVMEYVAGESLSACLRRGPVPAEQALEIGIQLADALSEAHAHGIIHRDLKPANVCLTPTGRVKVLDFGVAKTYPVDSARESADTATPEAALTRAGQILGTPGYLAPEQLLGKSVDGRSDIYSFGVLLFELLTRRLPFEESSAMGMALAALTEPLPSPSDIEASVPVEFGTIVSRAMAREPGERYQSAAELPADLRVMAAALNEESTSTRSIAWRVATVRLGLNRLSWRRRLGLAAGVMAVVILLVAVGLFVARWRTGGPESEIAATAGTLASSLAPSQRNLAVLPLTVGDEDVESRIFGRGLAEVLAIRLSQLSPAHGLQVAGATMVSELEEISAEEVGKRLGIGVVLLCGVQRDSGGLRVSVMLVDTAAGHELDSEEVTGTLSDAFGLQDRVVDAVMRMLRVELRPAEAEAMRAYGTSVARAYYLYLQARGYLQWWDGPEDFDSAVSIFRQALELDPNYALAYAGLGDAYWEKYRFTNDPQWPKETEQVCERAVALDEAHPAGHVCLG